jgi:hypothetical protein
MKSIDRLEHGGGHFHVRLDGRLIALPDPRQKHYQWVLTALGVGHVPGWQPERTEGSRPITMEDTALVFERWCAAWDLPDFNSARRLAYLIDNYRPAISHDLATRTHYDLGVLWRERRWTLLLDIIDRLPAHSWTASSLTMDEDHAKMMAESITAQRSSGEEVKPSGPALTTWTPEVAALTNVLDAVRNVQYAVVAVNAGKKAPEPPKPSPRPITPLERALKRAEFDRRKAKHEALVARVLPHKAGVKP